MAEIAATDNSSDPEVTFQSQESLTPSQRARMAKQKELALARRLARAQRQSVSGFSSEGNNPECSAEQHPPGQEKLSFATCSELSRESSCRTNETTRLGNLPTEGGGCRRLFKTGFNNQMGCADISMLNKCPQNASDRREATRVAQISDSANCWNHQAVTNLCKVVTDSQGSAYRAASDELKKNSISATYPDSFERDVINCKEESQGNLQKANARDMRHDSGSAVPEGGNVINRLPSRKRKEKVLDREQSLRGEETVWSSVERDVNDRGLSEGGNKSDSESPPSSPQALGDQLGLPEEIGAQTGPLKFSKQQMEVLEAVAAGKSVFVTGSAGTGKSYLLGFMIRILRKWLGQGSVFVTASTGIAACALGGTTVHSFAGVGLGTGSCNILAGKANAKKDVRNRWRAAKVLIIDEVSMIDGELFDKLEYVARTVREGLCDSRRRVFGGLQLIVTGDFFQLPPVNPENPQKYFAFEANCWDSCFDLQIELSHVFRQSDGGFVRVLNEIRTGSQSPQTLEMLKNCCKDVVEDGLGIVPTRLYPRKIEVKQVNEDKMKALGRETISFIARDWASSSFHEHILQYMRADKVSKLCIGAQVMLIKNLDTTIGLVNGARGVVVGFVSHFNTSEKDSYLKTVASFVSPTGKWPVVRFACDGRERTIGPQKESVEDRGSEVATRIQVPLILAWALSVHKCQGMTLDRVETDLSKAFDYGMVYVALSRVKNLDGLWLIGFDPSRIKVHPSVVHFYEKLCKRWPGPGYAD